MHYFKQLPALEEFDATFQEFHNAIVEAHVYYGFNGDEEYIGPEYGGSVRGVYEFLADTALPGEGILVNINEIDPTP